MAQDEGPKTSSIVPRLSTGHKGFEGDPLLLRGPQPRANASGPTRSWIDASGFLCLSKLPTDYRYSCRYLCTKIDAMLIKQ